MGAITILRTGRGRNIQEAWREVQDEDRREKGEDIYNGGANNCELVRDLTGKIKPKDLEKEAEKIGIGKREVAGVCVEKPILNTNSTKSIVKRNPQKGARKWVTAYVVYEMFSKEAIGSKSTLNEAIKLGRTYTEETQFSTIIRIEKVLKGTRDCAEVHYKKSSKERLGKWNFYGWAPY